MGWLYPLRVNLALAGLGINPQWLKKEYRQNGQDAGRLLGYYPQEVAILMASQLPAEYRSRMDFEPALKWIRTGYVRPQIGEVKGALVSLGWRGRNTFQN